MLDHGRRPPPLSHRYPAPSDTFPPSSSIRFCRGGLYDLPFAGSLAEHRPKERSPAAIPFDPPRVSSLLQSPPVVPPLNYGLGVPRSYLFFPPTSPFFAINPHRQPLTRYLLLGPALPFSLKDSGWRFTGDLYLNVPPPPLGARPPDDFSERPSGRVRRSA